MESDRNIIICDGIVPLCFPDEDLCRVLNFWSEKYREMERETIFEEHEENYQLKIVFPTVLRFPQYPLCCGLLIRLRTGLLRIQKRSRYFPSKIGAFANIEIRFFHLVRTFSDELGRQLIEEYFSPKTLLDLTIELSMKSINLSVPLQKDLNNHLVVIQPKYLSEGRDRHDNLPPKLLFCSDFLKRVLDYHAVVRRPEGTFDLNLDTETLFLIEKLSKLPRDKCSRCLGCRQVYCGPCGLRMPNAEELLPARVELPFDVLLLLHWQESLVKCTGITAAPLSTADSVRFELWPKEKTPEDWERLVGTLRPDRDVLLFPDRDAVAAGEFQWGVNRAPAPSSSASSPEQTDGSAAEPEGGEGRKWRLVILEGSWNYAKTMAWQIIAYRKERHLPPLPCVILKDLTGEYWRFHHEGHSAVSTIEAIAHTALAAGLSSPQFDDLLLLFRLQKWRVMCSVRGGGKVPKAVEVCGTGLGSWKDVTAASIGDDVIPKSDGDGSNDCSNAYKEMKNSDCRSGFAYDHDTENLKNDL